MRRFEDETTIKKPILFENEKSNDLSEEENLLIIHNRIREEINKFYQ